MRRLVIDTNVYIDWINHGRYEDVLFERSSVKYLSAVVLMELRAGASSAHDRRLLGRLRSSFEGARRLLTPSSNIFAEAGDALRMLQAERGCDIGSRGSLANDVLIALSARSLGATVVTQNKRDFRAIQSVRPFHLVTIPS